MAKSDKYRNGSLKIEYKIDYIERELSGITLEDIIDHASKVLSLHNWIDYRIEVNDVKLPKGWFVWDGYSKIRYLNDKNICMEREYNRSLTTYEILRAMEDWYVDLKNE